MLHVARGLSDQDSRGEFRISFVDSGFALSSDCALDTECVCSYHTSFGSPVCSEFPIFVSALGTSLTDA